MNIAQRVLVERTLRKVGIGLIVIFGLLMAWAIARVALLGAITWKVFFRGMFDIDDGALVLWPILFGGCACVWLSAYLKAGRVGE
ncbi:hypothetical protein [Pseudomonas sp. xss_2]|uniref:hypothetical protein n=1 Tax=Pseudomonas sp. xss_2 TaxID=3367215 RepID=UPI00370CC5EF